jgi:hypothetical protein
MADILLMNQSKIEKQARIAVRLIRMGGLISAAMQLCRKPWIWTSDMNLFLGVCPRI